MANLKSIKTKILSYKKTGTVTHAMEAVSAVKMRKGQERALSARAYAAAALSILERLSGTVDAKRHPLMMLLGERTEQGWQNKGKTIFIIITSDKGLAGALNSGVIRAVENKIKENDKLTRGNIEIFALGRRGADYFKNRGFDVSYERTNVNDDISESYVLEMTNIIKERVNPSHSDVGVVFVAYQNFISTFEQQPSVRQIVPITAEAIAQMVEGIRPAKGKYAPQHKEDFRHPAAYTIEPDADTVLDVLLPRLLNIAIFHALLENKASEHSARMVAMKSATDKAKEMAQGLTRTFNKVRQAAITREVSEITSGIEAMK